MIERKRTNLLLKTVKTVCGDEKQCSFRHSTYVTKHVTDVVFELAAKKKGLAQADDMSKVKQM